MRRSHVLLAGAVAVAGGAAVFGSDDGASRPAPVAALEGAPLVSTLGAATVASIGETGPSATAATTVTRRPTVDLIPSDRFAIAEVDLDEITLEGDHYVAPLADGRKAVLTLDPTLQALAEKLLNQSRAPRGAIVAMAPDGRILALAGRRTEEPEGSKTGTFDWRLATEVWAPAASLFKLVTASALVKAGVSPNGKVCYHGGVRSVMESNLRDSKRDSRCETLAYGVSHSQNAIMGKLAFQKLEPAVLEAEARSFGWVSPLAHLGGVTGELSLPASRDLDFAKAAAGFHGARLSVLGGALLAATFARDGEQPLPRLVASVDGVPAKAPPTRRAISAKIARAVARMMVGTCEHGSAAKAFRKGKRVDVAGKTGTLTRHKPFYIEHSWFVGFAPADEPEIVVSVLLGNGMDWHLRGHEAARRVIDRALKAASAREKGRTALRGKDKQNQW